MSPNYALLEAPSTLGLRSDGVQKLPDRLLQLGLADDIRARRAGRVAVPTRPGERDPQSTVLNADAIVNWSPKLADAVEVILGRREFPVILGGDCTILLGSMLALRRRGRFGLLFIDGNADFFQPEAEPNGEGASMDLAWVTGHGPDKLTNIEGRRPLVRDEDVVAFAFRDHEDQREFGSQPLPPTLEAIDLPLVRSLGVEVAAQRAVAHLTRPELEGFFIHVDADCLDDATMPAVDFRVPGGLTPGELLAVLRAALASGRAVGIEVAIYNPKLDEDGSAGERLAAIMKEALRRSPIAQGNAVPAGTSRHPSAPSGW